MKNKLWIVLALTAILLAACDAMPAIDLGGKKAEEELQLQEIQPEPTEAVLPEGSFFRDDLDDDVNNEWGLRIVSGLEKQLIWSQNNGKLRLQTLGPNDVNYIFLNKNRSYKDVIVQAEVENTGPTDNAYSLICRASEDGWYEFRISSAGYYELLRFDQYLRDEGKNAYTNYVERRMGSTKIVGGKGKNVFSLSCSGDIISAFINGEQVYFEKRPLAIEDNTYAEGSIGFGLVGYGRELDVTYNWVEAVKP